jgi:hypothetical protein
MIIKMGVQTERERKKMLDIRKASESVFRRSLEERRKKNCTRS